MDENETGIRTAELRLLVDLWRADPLTGGDRAEAVLGLLAARCQPGDGERWLAETRRTSSIRTPNTELRASVEAMAARFVGLEPGERASATDRLFNEVIGRDPRSNELHTPPDVNELLVGLVGHEVPPGPTDLWYDPASGTAGTAAAVDSVFGLNAGRYAGQELSEQAIHFARLRAAISGRPIDARVGDSLRTDRFEGEEASYVVCAPPLGLKIRNRRASHLDTAWPGSRSLRESTGLFTLASLAKLRDSSSGGGTAAVLVLPRFMNHGRTEEAFRRWLFEEGLVVGAVQLPDQLLNNTRLATSILVLSNRPERDSSTVRVVDASGIFSDSRVPGTERGRLLSGDQVNEIVSEFWSPRNSRFARSVSVSRLLYRRIRLSSAQPGEVDGAAPEGVSFSIELPNEPDAIESLQSPRHPALIPYGEEETVYRIVIEDLMGSGHEARRAYLKSFGDDLVCLAQLTRSATTVRDASDESWTTNSIFVPSSGGPIRTHPTEDQRVRRGAILDLDDQYCTNEYVALLLGGPIGELLRSSKLNTAGPRTATIGDILSLRVPVPALEEQAAIVREWRRMSVISAGINRLKSQLLEDYRQRAEIIDEVSSLTESSNLETWLKSVPSPMASAIWAYRSMDSASDKMDQLIKSFESAAEFVAMVLLSACQRDSDLASQVFPDLNRSLEDKHMSFERATFGTWTTTVTLVAKRLRKMLNADPESHQRCLRAFNTTDERFVLDLTSTSLGDLFKEVNAFRNRWTGHGGIRSERESSSHVEELLSQLVELQRLMLYTWRRTILVSPGRMTYGEGSYRYSARRLTGLSVPFENVAIELDKPMEDSKLHLYFESSGTALELAPIVQMGPAPSSSLDSFYFFNRVDPDDKVRLVSYHHPDSPEVTVEATGLLDFVRSISSRESPEADD